MKPINLGGHTAYQDHVLTLMRKYYPDPDSIPSSTWTIIDHFWHLDLSRVDEQMADRYSIFGPSPRLPSCMLRSEMLSLEFKVTSFTEWAAQLKINPLYAWFTMLGLLPEATISKVLLDSAHDANALYRYFKKQSFVPFIDLNSKRGKPRKYKDDFDLGDDGVPICPAGKKMNRDGCDIKKHRLKFRCPLVSRKYGCSCDNPCSDSPYGRTVWLQMKDDPRLINIPPRTLEEWKLEYNARTSSERCNKREKNDFLLESGKHRSSGDWYCRLYCIMTCQHLDAWDLPYESQLQSLLRQAA